MEFPKNVALIAAMLLVLAIVVGGILAYPRVPWMGEIPSRLEIAGETVLGTLTGDRMYRSSPGARALLGGRPGAARMVPQVAGAGPVPTGAGAPGAGPVPTSVGTGASGVADPSFDIAARLEEAVSHQADWLLACRTASGTFAVAPGADLIIPYFANQAAWALLPEYAREVKGHLEWYLAHLNRSDRWGLAGTVYDYRIEGDREVPTGSYDSADAYAATFLTAVARYWQVTGDTRFVQDRRADLDLVAQVIVALQDTDGLAWARPGHWVKYLMDNAENFQGLADYAWLLGELGDGDAARYWAGRAEAVRAGIRQVMYNPRRGDYYWAVKMSGTRRLPNWRQWYPDAVAQLFPVLCGVESPDSRTSRAVYERFVRFYPGWASLPRSGRSPWGVITPVAVTMGDTDHLEAGLASTRELPARASVWHAGEAAYLLQAARLWLSHLTSPGEMALSVPGGTVDR